MATKTEVEFYNEKDDVSVVICEDVIDTLTDEELAEFRISRDEMRKLFTEAAKMLVGVKPSDRTRVVADEILNGKFELSLVEHSAISDPLMQDIPTKTKN